MKFNSFLLVCWSLTLFSSQAATYKEVARVEKLRGKVTILSPGQLESRKLRQGDRVKEDTSILTGKASFAKLVFDDGSTINVGPNSKTVVVRMDGKGNGIVSLLKGKMRSHIKKNKNGDKKFYVQTRTAAMAVRGTEFETIYNPDNRVSSLLTYRGEVAVSKTDDLVVEDDSKQNKAQMAEDSGDTQNPRAKKIIKRDGQRIRVLDRPKRSLSATEKLERVFKKKDTVVVKGGQFSSTVKKLDVVSQPVKISPVQLNALYKNPEYLQKKSNRIKKADLNVNQANLALPSVEQEVPAEGVFDAKNKKFAAKAGGFLDLETGLYVAPGADATFDVKKNIFQVKSDGAIDATTGQYQPPKGMKLVADKGFVIDKKNLVASAKTKDLKVKVSQLNQSLGKDLVLAKDNKKADTSLYSSLVNRELYAKNVVTVSMKSYNLNYKQSDDSFLSGGESTYDDISVNSLDLSLRYSSGKRWQPFTSLSLITVDSEGVLPSTITQDGDELWNLEAGVYYSLKPRLNLLLSLALDQQYFIDRTAASGNTSASTKFIRVALPKANIALEGSFAHSKRWSLNFLSRASLIMGRETGSLTTDMGFALQQDLFFKFWWARKYFIDLGLFLGLQRVSSEGTSQVFTADVQQVRSGAYFTLGFAF